MDLLGDDLWTLFYNRCGGRFSLKTICMIAIQLLLRVEALHTKTGKSPVFRQCRLSCSPFSCVTSGYVHCDLKQGNMVMGRNRSRSVLHLIDMNLAKPFIDIETGEHVESDV
jgi:serine/threonine protein kinase